MIYRLLYCDVSNGDLGLFKGRVFVGEEAARG